MLPSFSPVSVNNHIPQTQFTNGKQRLITSNGRRKRTKQKKCSVLETSELPVGKEGANR